jgi:uncharacterized protein YukE
MVNEFKLLKGYTDPFINLQIVMEKLVETMEKYNQSLIQINDSLSNINDRLTNL